MKNIINNQKVAADLIQSAQLGRVSLHDSTGRYYVNLSAAKASFRGDRSTKIYINNKGVVVLTWGKGTTTGEFDDAVTGLIDFCENNGIEVKII